MFKVGKIKQVTNEKVNIKLRTIEKGSFKGNKTTYKKIKVLSFDITSDEYSFFFEMGKEIEKLLEIPMEEKVDFKDYIVSGDMFDDHKNKKVFIDNNIDISIFRYAGNSFEITIKLSAEELNPTEEYSGIIVFDFDLDNYLDK